jgi:hypothetical protein
MRPVLLVPGIGDSGPDHWQSIWQEQHPGVRRVTQRDWNHPVCDEWVEALDQAIRQAAVPPILVAHSLGCLAVAHWATRSSSPCFAMLLVAVPDPAGPSFPKAAIGFHAAIPAPACRRIAMVSSDDDAYATPQYTAQRAAAWGAEHTQLRGRGHLNAESGLGDWTEGWAIVDRWRQE